MKKLYAKDLVKGNLYSDSMDEKNATILEFIKINEYGNPMFKHSSGVFKYFKDANGLISFTQREYFYNHNN